VSLDFLGAGEGLATKYITLRVRRIDVEKLKKKLGGTTGAGAGAAIPLVDTLPEIALRTALPFVAQKAADDYGVDMEWQVTDAPPGQGSLKSGGFGEGAIAGAGAAAAACAILYFGLKHLL